MDEPQPPRLTPATRHRAILALPCLVLLTVAAYEGVRGCDFLHYDDDLFVTGNPIVRQGLTWSGVRWAFKADLFYDSHLADYWAPVTVLSRMLDVSLFGLRPAGHHLTNLLLHCLNVVLVFLVFHRLTGAVWRSAFVAAVLAVHPLHVESVAWVSERKDMLSGAFWMLTVGAYVGYARSPGRRRMAVVAALLAFGLMAKPMLVTLPFVLLLLDYWPLGRWNLGRRLIAEKWPLFVLAAASVAISLLPNLGAKTLDALPLGARAANALDAYVAYLQQAFWPTHLALGYPHSEGSLPVARLVLCVAVLGFVSAIAVAERTRRPYLLVGWLWFVGALIPVIGLVQSGSHGRADRYMYIPLLGISMAVAWLAAEWAGRFPRGPAAMALLGTLAILSLAALTRRQVPHWADDLALWSHSVEVQPQSAIAHNGLASALARKGDVAGAESEWRETLRLKPDFIWARITLGTLLAQRGRGPEGALLLEDGFAGVPPSRFLFERGLLRARQGRSAEAADYYAQAIAENPAHRTALYNWGNLLAAAGRFDEAAAKYAASSRLDPDDGDVANNLGMALLLQGRADAAVQRLAEAVDFDPENGLLRTSLGRALSAQGRGAEAATQFGEALRLDPANAEARSALQALEPGRP
jgi:protein O-mannosyl-transferase